MSYETKMDKEIKEDPETKPDVYGQITTKDYFAVKCGKCNAEFNVWIPKRDRHGRIWLELTCGLARCGRKRRYKFAHADAEKF